MSLVLLSFSPDTVHSFGMCTKEATPLRLRSVLIRLLVGKGGLVRSHEPDRIVDHGAAATASRQLKADDPD